jgi:flagellar protein FliJ
MAGTKSLTTLIKVAKQQLDSLRRDLANLETEKQKMLDAIARLKAELQREMELASQNPEMGAFFGDFSKRIRAREAEFKEKIQKLDIVMDKLRDRIREQFAEQKKYELAKEQREKEERETRERNEVKALDEMAAIRHQRKQRD